MACSDAEIIWSILNVKKSNDIDKSHEEDDLLKVSSAFEVIN